MPVSKTWNNSSYSLPNNGERNWTQVAGFLQALADNAQTTDFQLFSARTATSTPVTVSATTDCIVITDLTSPGAVAVNLPAGVTGQIFCIVDGEGDAATNNITITPAAGLINGSATYVINKTKGSVILAYDGTGWKILAEFTTQGVLSIAQGGTGQSTQTNAFDALSPTTTKGDLAVHNGTDNIRLGVGTNGFAIVADSGAASGLAYASVVTNPMDSAGDMIYGGASGVATKLDSGTANTVLTSAGAASPVWQTIVNANVNASAAIAGTKISPAFGSQNISNTGTLNTSGTITAGDDVSITGTGSLFLNITGDNTNDIGLRLLQNSASNYVFSNQANSNALTLESAAGREILFNTGGAITRAKFTSGGLLEFNTSNGLGIKLPTSGGTASTLDYYEEFTHSTNVQFNGTSPGAATAATVNGRRIGKQVFLSIDVASATTGTGSSKLSSATGLASRFRPTINKATACQIKINNTKQIVIGLCVVYTDGTFDIFVDGSEATAWTAAQANSGLAQSVSVSYFVT